MKKSLLIVGHPKGFTSRTYAICKRATRLRDSGVSAGEILNWQRNASIERRPFLDDSDEGYRCYEKHLRAMSRGFIIKDVVQPHVVLRFLEQNPGVYNVLYIHRDSNDVMLQHKLAGWSYYPDPEVFARRFRKYPTVEYEDITSCPKVIFDALRGFGYRVRTFNYINERFTQRRESTRQRLKQHRDLHEKTDRS